MQDAVTVFMFSDNVQLDEIEMTLAIARFTAEGRFGAARLLMELHCELDGAARTVRIDTGNEIGEAVAQAFAGLALREYGEQRVRIGKRARPDTVQANAPVGSVASAS